jgi:hypothetical protein
VTSTHLAGLAGRLAPSESAIEIDARTIQGAGGEVRWQLEDGGHVVTVTDAAGIVQARLHVVDGRVARELYEHPFALSSVPNLFEHAVTPSTD